MKYCIAINKLALSGKLPQGDARWAMLNDGFENREIEPVDFLDAIYTGHPYSAWFNGRRKQEHFICAQHIAVDMDTQDKRSTITAVESNYFFRLYGSIIHTTPSHTAQAPKCRAIFLLDEPIKTATGYRQAMATVYGFFDGADVACIDPARFFYGNLGLQSDPDGLVYVDKTLPIQDLRRYARQMLLLEEQQRQAAQSRYQRNGHGKPAGNAYAQAAFEQEVQAVRTAGSGGRNVQLNKSAFSLGQLVSAGILDEVEVSSQLEQAAVQTGLPASEIAKTLVSGLRAGKQKPRELLQ